MSAAYRVSAAACGKANRGRKVFPGSIVDLSGVAHQQRMPAAGLSAVTVGRTWIVGIIRYEEGTW